MIYGYYLSTAGALVQSHRQDVIASNVANVSTAGFRRNFALFRRRETEGAEERVPDYHLNRLLEGVGGGILLDETPWSEESGRVDTTGDAFDLALAGDGFFVVDDGRGQRFYTRAGDFARGPDGTLLTQDGRHRVLGEDGQPLRITAETFRVERDGSIDGGAGGRLMLRRFDDPTHVLDKVGRNVYRAAGDARARPFEGEVRQGALELSNVDPVSEMVAMIQALRAYEANLTALRTQDEGIERIVRDVARPTP